MEFIHFKTAVAKQFERLQKHDCFRVDIPTIPELVAPGIGVQDAISGKDQLWSVYLGAFPVGTNEVYRERTEHDCSCCKQFIRAIGDMVAIIDGKVETIWDVKVDKEPGYQVVADALSAFVKKHAIVDEFLHYENTAGTHMNFEQTTEGVKTWNHFFVNIAPKFVKPNADIATLLNGSRTRRQVFVRALEEITDEAVNTALDLIRQNSLYRGAEKKAALEGFIKAGQEYYALAADQRSLWAWEKIKTIHPAVAHIRNDAIGTLLIDLSADVDLDVAVKKWETVMAPANYQRPTAIVTKAMIEKAKTTLDGLGLTSALERRYATLSDISINDIIFADNNAKKVINGSVFDDMLAQTSAKVNAKALDKVEEMHIDKFLSDVVPRATTLEVLLENQHAGNFVSLIAPVDPTANSLFKWNNKFSWDYAGGVADSVKERVKAAGGNVTGDLCCRLSWFNYDDLDFHMLEPDGHHIQFVNKGRVSACGGMLDVDMNMGGGGPGRGTREPVENIFYASRAKMKEGQYSLYVNNYAQMEKVDVGFQVDIDYLGTVTSFRYEQAVKNKENVGVATFKYTHARGIEFLRTLPSSATSQPVRTIWSLPTQTFHKVNVLCLSPNHWEGERKEGNKHYFFVLQGAINDGVARGFFNEFLKPELIEHRKVFEMVGAKMKLNPDNEQLSGLGFSSTQRGRVIVRVGGSFTRTLKVTF